MVYFKLLKLAIEAEGYEKFPHHMVYFKLVEVQ